MTEREEFLDIFHRYVTRPGSEKLLDWLDTKTDFFTAPAPCRLSAEERYRVSGRAVSGRDGTVRRRALRYRAAHEEPPAGARQRRERRFTAGRVA